MQACASTDYTRRTPSEEALDQIEDGSGRACTSPYGEPLKLLGSAFTCIMLFFIVRAAPPPNVTPNSFSALSVSSSFELRSCNKQQLPGPAQPDHVELAQIKRCAIKLKIRMAKRKHQNSVLARMGGEGSERQPQGAKFTRTKSDEEILSSDKGIWLFWVLITKSSLNSQLGLLVEIVLCSVHQWPYIVRDIKVASLTILIR